MKRKVSKQLRRIVIWALGLFGITLNKKITLTTYLRHCVGLLPRGLGQCRAMFKDAVNGRETWGVYLKLKMFTPRWDRTYFRWLELCPDEKETMGCFFGGYSYVFWKTGDGANQDTSPLLEKSGAKWLTFLTDSTYRKHLEWVHRLGGDWSVYAPTLQKLALDRRMEFSVQMLQRASNWDQAIRTLHYAIPDSTVAVLASALAERFTEEEQVARRKRLEATIA